MRRKDLAYLFGAALVFRLLVNAGPLLDPSRAISNDTSLYRILGAELLRGRFSGFFRTPGYPLFLALTGGTPGHTPYLALVAQVLLDSLSAVLLALTAWKLCKDQRAAWLAGIAWAVCPIVALLSGALIAETVCLFLIVLGLWMVVSRQGIGWWALAGLCWGAATLARPSSLLVPGAVLALLAGFRLKQLTVLSGLLSLAIYGLTVGSWVGVNYARCGRPILSTLPDFTTYMYELPAVRTVEQYGWASYTKLWVLHPREGEEIREGFERRFIAEAYPEGSRPRNLWMTIDDPQETLRLRTLAMSQLDGRAFSLAGVHVVGALQILRPLPPRGALYAVLFLVDAVSLLVTAAAMVWILKERRWQIAAGCSLWLGYAFLLPGANGVWRFRSLAEPVFTLLIAAAFTFWKQRVPTRSIEG